MEGGLKLIELCTNVFKLMFGGELKCVVGSLVGLPVGVQANTDEENALKAQKKEKEGKAAGQEVVVV